MKIGELFVELGFKADTIKLKDFMHSIGELNMSSIMATMGLGGMYNTVKKIMSVAEETAMGVHAFTAETGMSAQKMQQWTHFAEGMGASTDTVASGLKTLQSHLAGLKMGIDFSLLAPFALLNRVGAGINMTDTPDVVLEKMGKVLGRLTDENQRLVLSQMGLNDEWKLFIKQLDSEEWKNQPFMTEKQTEALKKYHTEVAGVGSTWKTMLGDIGASLAPTLEGFLRLVNVSMQFVRNSPGVQQALMGILGILVLVLMALLPVTAAWIAWGAAIALVVAGLGWIGNHLKDIGNWMDKVKSFNPFKDFGRTHMPELGLVGAGSSSKTTSNTYHFKIFSNDPEEAGRSVAREMRKIHGDAWGQAPTENN